MAQRKPLDVSLIGERVEVDMVALWRIVDEWGGRDAEIFHQLYDDAGQPTSTYAEVAERYGVSVGRIRQVEQRIIRQLRHPRIYRQWWIRD